MSAPQPVFMTYLPQGMLGMMPSVASSPMNSTRKPPLPINTQFLSTPVCDSLQAPPTPTRGGVNGPSTPTNLSAGLFPQSAVSTPNHSSISTPNAASIPTPTSSMWVTGPDGKRLPIPAKIKVKDPAVKGNVQYDVPASKITPTYGLWEYLDGTASQLSKGGRGVQVHRATLCKLYLEDRCSRDSKCKSFHLDRDFVAQMREEMKVEFDDSFLTEVVVETSDGSILAVRYNALGKTKGLEDYKMGLRGPYPIHPIRMCRAFDESVCELDRMCSLVHVKSSEFKENVCRTPCCYKHGDRTTAGALNMDGSTEVKGRGMTWTLPHEALAYTNGVAKGMRTAIGLSDICSMHIRSRCKFGRACDRLHVCRSWASTSGISGVLASRTSRFNGTALQLGGSTHSLGSSLNCNTPKGACAHPPSPSTFSLISAASSDSPLPRHAPHDDDATSYMTTATTTPTHRMQIQHHNSKYSSNGSSLSREEEVEVEEVEEDADLPPALLDEPAVPEYPTIATKLTSVPAPTTTTPSNGRRLSAFPTFDDKPADYLDDDEDDHAFLDFLLSKRI
eukprot:Sspe_Gene.50340::Locus_27934_Transcript_1_1_Confidence_1.000_Length_2032::g.50340::m.50340